MSEKQESSRLKRLKEEYTSKRLEILSEMIVDGDEDPRAILDREAPYMIQSERDIILIKLVDRLRQTSQ